MVTLAFFGIVFLLIAAHNYTLAVSTQNQTSANIDTK
jgi:hypothetical protein